MPDIDQQLDALKDWFQTLTPSSVARVVEFYDPRAHFKDPFNDVQGVEAIMQVFAHMFVTAEAPRFVILDTICAAESEGRQAFVSWRFEFGLRGRLYQIQGATHFRFSAEGKVTEHRDYWDAAEELFQKLPWIGTPIGWLRRRFRSAG
jgi:hypothetical protein